MTAVLVGLAVLVAAGLAVVAADRVPQAGRHSVRGRALRHHPARRPSRPTPEE